ncbi:hypothetical protein L0Z36_27620 [Burkholderia multivorans]|uniref:hypothetical protein n=1 Tax=Burkholderia multivorans TaxID=87883 RepID=UPI000D002C1D|nr:hypothetical protein [Burkholderia multivorans]MBU9150658.1 hypothetical protein [Burkholderia multivorans]MBU9483729.1 hypothetical protein [Burkholderia multivorans]MBY4670754.1 hypothetical protein [Burkholderia multivorans]PRG85654.1 hypothetical protein C6V04_29405 [Burkholderia multivorans]UQP03180.1 hypothetical protein L0Z36_27620 [Burkholderia multivorans]
MESPLCLRYRQCEIRACALVDAVAGEGLELGALYRPLAVVCWRDAQGRHQAHLLDPKHHVFRDDTDALRISIALAKRFIDTKLVGTFMPAG